MTRGTSSITTTYARNSAGDIQGLTYNDGTPPVAYGYNRRGQPSVITTGSGGGACTSSLLYDDAG